MDRGDDTGQAAVDGHGLGGALYLDHVGEAFLGEDVADRVVDMLVLDVGVGNPQSRILEALDVVVHAAVGAGGNGNRGVERILLEGAALFAGFKGLQDLDLVAGRGLDNRAVREAGKDPHGIDQAVADSRGGLAVADEFNLHLVPQAEGAEEALCSCGRA